MNLSFLLAIPLPARLRSAVGDLGCPPFIDGHLSTILVLGVVAYFIWFQSTPDFGYGRNFNPTVTRNSTSFAGGRVSPTLKDRAHA